MITRDEFVENLKTQLDGLHAGIKKIELKLKSVRKTAKAKLISRIKYLREKRDSALLKIQEIKNTSEETWQDLKQGAEDVVNTLSAAITKTMTHFKKKNNDLIAVKATD